MSTVQFHCSACGQPLEVDSSGVGMAVSCPICGGQTVVSGESQPNASSAIDGYSSGQRRRPRAVLAGILLMCAIVAGAWLLHKPRSGARLERLQAPTAAIGGARQTRGPAQPAPEAAPEPATRSLSFPAGQRLGMVCLEPEAGPGWDPIRMDLPYGWECYRAAQGHVCVPKGRNIQLMTRLGLDPRESAALRAQDPGKYRFFEASRIRQDPEDLSGLANLEPNDLHRLTVNSLMKVSDADQRVLRPIRHLTGLRILCLTDTGVTDQGMDHLRPLRALKSLSLRESGISDQGLTSLLDLPALECLSLEMAVSDPDLKVIGRHPNLRCLSLLTGRILGPGLAELASAPRLEHLCLHGTSQLTDQHIRYLETLVHLKSLTLWSVADNLTDASLSSIGKQRQLEQLHFIRTDPRFTPAGVAHLKGLAKLKALDFSFAWGPANGVRYGDAVARQLAAQFPHIECLKGVGYLSADGLKTLAVLKELKSLGVALKDSKQGYRGPAGLSCLAALSGLEELWITRGDTLSDADFTALESLGKLRELGILSTVTERGLASIGKLGLLESLWIKVDSRRGLNALNHLSHLKKLQVTTWGTADAGWTDSQKLDLRGLKHLTNLNLSGLRLQDDDLAFLEHLPMLEDVFISTESLTGACLHHLNPLPELQNVYISRLSGCTGEDLAQLNALPKLRDLHLAGCLAGTALTSLTGPPSLQSLNIDTDDRVPKETVTGLAQSHPVLEYIRVNPVPNLSGR